MSDFTPNYAPAERVAAKRREHIVALQDEVFALRVALELAYEEIARLTPPAADEAPEEPLVEHDTNALEPAPAE